MPPTALCELPFSASVVKTSARREVELGSGVAKPDASGEIESVIILMARSRRILTTA
jgi:hypothetical protein